jgi:nucleotide-binding universal stress UspA family protein
MLTKIIIPIDFSDCALNAIRYANQLSIWLDTELHIVYAHSVELITASTSYGVPYWNTMPVPDYVHQQMKQVQEMLKDKGVKVHSYIKEGNLNDVVAALAVSNQADLIVMGTESNQHLNSSFWGTNTSRLIAEKKTPVLVVPLTYKENLERQCQFVFATDFKGIAFIPPFFVELAEKLNAKINLFYDVEPYRDEVDREEELKDFNFVQEIFPKQKISLHHTFKENLIHAISDFSAKNKASLVFMIAHHRGFLSGLFHQSNTKQMALHTTIPFLAIPDEKEVTPEPVLLSGIDG